MSTVTAATPSAGALPPNQQGSLDTFTNNAWSTSGKRGDTSDTRLDRLELEYLLQDVFGGDITKQQAGRLVQIYGDGTFVDKATILTVMAQDGFLVAKVGAGDSVSWSLNWDNIDGTKIGQALLRTHDRDGDRKLSAEEFRDAVNKLFDPADQLSTEDAEFLVMRYGIDGKVDAAQMGAIFDRQIRLDGTPVDGEPGERVNVYFDRSHPNAGFATDEDAAAFIMMFDGHNGGAKDGKIDREEFKAALEAKLGKDIHGKDIKLTDELVDKYMLYYGEKDGSGRLFLTDKQVKEMLSERTLYLDDKTGGFAINLNIAPIRRVVRGASRDDDMLNRHELQALLKQLGVGELSLDQIDTIIKIYGNGQKVVTVDQIMTAMTEEVGPAKKKFLTLGENILTPVTMNWDGISGGRIAYALFREAKLDPTKSIMSAKQFNDAVDALFGDRHAQSLDLAKAQAFYYGTGNGVTAADVAQMFNSDVFILDGRRGEKYVRLKVDNKAQKVLSDKATPKPPITRAQIEEIETKSFHKFLDKLEKAPEGSDERKLYDLLKIRGYAQTETFRGKVDLAKVQADINELMQKPGIIKLMTDTHTEVVKDVLKMTPAQAAEKLSAWLTDDKTVAWLNSLPEADRANLIKNWLAEVQYFDRPTGEKAAKALYDKFSKLELESRINDPISDRSETAVVTAVDTVFQAVVNGGRGVQGGMQAFIEGYAALTATQKADAAAFYGGFLKSGKTTIGEYVATLSAADQAKYLGSELMAAFQSSGQASIETFLNGLNAEQRAAFAGAEIFMTIDSFHTQAKVLGVTGALNQIFSVLALVLDFTERRSPKTLEEKLNTAADILSVIGQGENFYRLFKTLGVDLEGMRSWRNVMSTFAAANRMAVEDGIELAESPLHRAISRAGPNPTAEALEASLSGDDAAREVLAVIHGIDPADEAAIDEIIEELVADVEALEAAEAAGPSTSAGGAVLPEGEDLFWDFDMAQLQIVGTVEDVMTPWSPTAATATAPGEAGPGGVLPTIEEETMSEIAAAQTADVAAAAAAEEGLTLGTSSSQILGRIFAGTAVVGGVAAFLYLPGLKKAYDARKAAGDDAGAAIMAGIMANASLGGFLGVTAGGLMLMPAEGVGGLTWLGSSGFLLTEAIPVVGILSAIVGIGLFAANQIQQRLLRDENISDGIKLIEGGGSNGKSYKAPGAVMPEDPTLLDDRIVMGTTLMGL